ncbi:microtubule associated protein-domain-containing protein [Phellopilus nigrolimitatus]|nr:microtubule associated protein-domain-containing protein [Phellopilus nigrolimitatus]
MRKCDVVERDCLKYTKALGGHIKTISASVGELRKQQVLPVRHEMLNQHQDKLDQLYKTKLEQLSNLTNRVTSLSRILGPDFFALGVVDFSPVYSENDSDALLLRDVTPERFSKLEKELVRGKGEITRRLQHLSATFLRMDWLYTELEIPPPSCDEIMSPAPSTSSLLFPASHRSRSASVSPADPFMSSASSISTPTPCPRGKLSTTPLLTDTEPVSDYHRLFALFILRMDEAEEEGKAIEPNALVGVEGVEPTVGLMSWAEQTKAELEDVKKRRETAIQSMYDQLEALWKRLGVEDADIDAFVEHNRGSAESNVHAYEAELERMLELKRERMSVFIGNARAEIETLWDILMISEEERADFTPFVDDEHTEELLTTHEEEIRRLKEERRMKAPLLAGIRKYFEICEEEKELTAAAQDQNRLLGRGPRDPGRLLREEKMRKRVSREKPRLGHELMLSIPAWEEDQGKPFLINGVSVVDLLLEAMGTDKENAQNKKPRAGSVPPRSTTPSNSGPAPNKPRSTGSTSTSNKRVKLASSTSGAQRACSTSSSRGAQDNHALPHRAPFGSRTGVMNRAVTTPDAGFALNPPTTAQKRSRTPSNSTLPRPVSAASRTHPPPVPTIQRSTHGAGTGIGLGYASTMQRTRVVSASAASAKTYSLMDTVAHRNSKAMLQAQSTRAARNSRRESFRPRPSINDAGAWSGIDSAACRYTGGLSSAVEEED